MSIQRAVEIRCDAGCGDAWTDYGTAQDLRRRMKEHGWATTLPGGRDLCPDCRLNNDPEEDPHE